MTRPQMRPALLCILDGFGYRENADDNAIAQAKTPVWDGLWQDRPHSFLEASGEDVGLPAGQMGNSEVGHMNIGAGRVVFQDLPLIDRSIEQGDLPSNKYLVSFIEKLKKSGGACHLMGLASPGGVHSHQNHIVALAKVLHDAGVAVHVHAFLDGRDVPPQSAVEQIDQLSNDLNDIGGVQLSTLCGRYYAMDRDNRWDRVERAYAMLVKGEGKVAVDSIAAIKDSYSKDITDEFVEPVVLNGYAGMDDGDGILFANFRADRAREILTALLSPSFDGFERDKIVSLSASMGMVEYSSQLKDSMGALFPPKEIKNSLGEVVANAGLKQLRIAETEKYPHVTFFLNGGREEPFENEERILVPSPKVATYDLQPEMSASEVTNKVVDAIESDDFDLIVLNYANPDMVGHTGDLGAAIKAVEAVDASLGRVVAYIERAGGVALITADHGNCECMYNDNTQGPHTAHTLSKVPLVLISPDRTKKLRDGRLSDVAPTLLEFLELEKPSQMDGESLLDA